MSFLGCILAPIITLTVVALDSYCCFFEYFLRSMSDYSFNLVSLLRGLLSLGVSRVEALHICVQYMVALCRQRSCYLRSQSGQSKGTLGGSI